MLRTPHWIWTHQILTIQILTIHQRRKAARIVVAGCGLRFHRALQVIQHAERKMFLHRQNNVLAGFPEPVRLASGGPYR